MSLQTLKRRVSSLEYRYVFLHGFASGPSTRKGQHLKEFFAKQSIPLFIPDLNIPSFEELQVSLILKFLENNLNIEEKKDDTKDIKSIKWRIIASSLGGFIATRFAELYPERVDSLLLLAPAFDLPERWKNRLNLEEWKSNGALSVYNYKSKCMNAVKYIFYQDLKENHPSYPIPTKLLMDLVNNNKDQSLKETCHSDSSTTITIVHGKQDSSVPLDTTEEFIRKCNEAVPASGDTIDVHIVEDGHELTEPSTLSLFEKIISEKWLLR
ncbi:hypothetical protein C9374_010168 [Naegleria lovaniensis]|uniref:Palmitoyl-protein thioesterase ABHD10, mitochondrial n=1 Tax=Naegleria lovaniensis TaxID=51637 RepID=A0AA88GIF6_NAELO|nr:uncharacterized protein C9374_010168 [Naegleria lovaniensis]KAG2375164.1 hypothetical protein C9374_010168 [Naegleria lovaniensis]